MRQTLDEQIECYEKCLLFALEDIAHETFCGTCLPIQEYICFDEEGTLNLSERGQAALRMLQKKYLTFSWQVPILH